MYLSSSKSLVLKVYSERYCLYLVFYDIYDTCRTANSSTIYLLLYILSYCSECLVTAVQQCNIMMICIIITKKSIIRSPGMSFRLLVYVWFMMQDLLLNKVVYFLLYFIFLRGRPASETCWKKTRYSVYVVYTLLAAAADLPVDLPRLWWWSWKTAYNTTTTTTNSGR